MDDSLTSLRGVRFRETILTNYVAHYGSSRGTLSPNSSSTGSPVPAKICGPLTLFSFVLPAKHEKVTYSEQKQYLKSAFEESSQFQGGLLLVTREKGVLFPVVHMSDSQDGGFGSSQLGEISLGGNVTIHQAVYEEVRKIMPETELPRVAPVPQMQDKIGYILLGFKSLDRKFSQVMLDTWKDWTGARYIYMYLPDDLGLRRISLYHRQQPDDLNLFTYLVVVECHGITNGEKLNQLLDFAQRMRLERLTGYVSVYAGEKFDSSESPTPPFPVIRDLDLDLNLDLDADYLTGKKKTGIADDIFSVNSLDRNSRM